MKNRYEAITEKQWEKIQPILPAEYKPQGGRPAKDNRKMLNAILWITRTGSPWRDLPECYGPWQSVYTRFRRWEQAGIFEQILKTFSSEPDAESVMIDSTIVRVHQHGAGAKGGSLLNPSDDHAGD